MFGRFDAACHKLLPSAGLGAVTAMQDAVTLANCLYDMKGLSPLDVKEAFEMYKEERYSKVKNQFSASKTNAKLIYGHVGIDSFRTIKMSSGYWSVLTSD